MRINYVLWNENLFSFIFMLLSTLLKFSLGLVGLTSSTTNIYTITIYTMERSLYGSNGYKIEIHDTSSRIMELLLRIEFQS